MNDVTLTTFDNVGKDYSLGAELMLDYGSVSILEYQLDGDYLQLSNRGNHPG